MELVGVGWSWMEVGAWFSNGLFIFGTKFSWNEGIDTYFNAKCVLLSRNFDFLGGYLVDTWWLLGGYWSLLSGYCSLLDGYWWLLLLAARYCSFPLLV